MTSTTSIEDNSHLFSILDATYLDPKADEKDIIAFCEKVKDSNAVSICLMPQWISTAKSILQDKNIALCAAINFPGGEASDDEVVEEAQMAVKNGATELDVVVPYDILKYDEGFAIKTMIEEVVKACPKTIVKAILETGKLENDKAILKAAGAAAMGGADFLKTSTGYTEIGATPQSVATLAEFIKIYPGKIGLKISGGVRDPETANQYIEQVESILGLHWCHPKRFRIGGSTLFHTLCS